MTELSKIDELAARVGSLPDSAARAAALELVRAVMDVHAKAIGRMLEIVAAGTDGVNAIRALAGDDLTSAVLGLHGLHPDDLETRIGGAIAKLRRFFDSRGAGIELLGIEDGAVRVRYAGSRPGAGAAARELIEDALYEAAPEIVSVTIDGIEPPRSVGFVPVSDLVRAQPL